MIPKIIFHRSGPYDKHLKHDAGFENPPEDSLLNEKMRAYEKAWEKDGEKILRELSAITKLPWQEKEIICYITWGVGSFSDPLTLNIEREADDAVQLLAHELTHRLLSHKDNTLLVRKNWKLLMEKYKEHPPVTQVHIVIHAIHEHILRKLYSEKALLREKNLPHSPNYVLAWKIVEKDGYQNIIAELVKE